MNQGVVPHAINRALERYGLKLTYGDLLDLCAQCMKGDGRLGYMPDGKERHLVGCHGRALVAVYIPFDGERVFQKQGRIVTLLPPEAASPQGKYWKSRLGIKPRLRPPPKSPRKSRRKKWRIMS